MVKTAQTSLPAFGLCAAFIERELIGSGANLIEVSEVKTGSFPVPANVAGRKK